MTEGLTVEERLDRHERVLEELAEVAFLNAPHLRRSPLVVEYVNANRQHRQEWESRIAEEQRAEREAKQVALAEARATALR